MKRYATYVLCLPLTAALLAACGGGGGGTTTGPAPVLPVAAPITTVNGTVDSWKGGASTVELLAQPFTVKSATNPALASATLNANGTFALTLPSLATITPYLSATASASNSDFGGNSGCKGTVTNSDPSAQGYSFSVLNAGDTLMSTLNSSATNATTTAISRKEWLYVTKPTTLDGSVVCTDTLNSITTTVSIKTPLVQGWNVVASMSTLVIPTGSTSGTGTVNYSTVSDASTIWYLPQAVPVGAQSLQAQRAASHFAASQATFGKLLGGHFGF